MTTYSTYDHTTQEHEEFYALAPAKKWMKERISLGHEVSGSKTKIYSHMPFSPASGWIETREAIAVSPVFGSIAFNS